SRGFATDPRRPDTVAANSAESFHERYGRDGRRRADKTCHSGKHCLDAGGRSRSSHIGLRYGAAAVTGTTCISAILYDQKTGAWPWSSDLRVDHEAARWQPVASKQREGWCHCDLSAAPSGGVR